jgi:hypothetical protein
MAISNQSYYRRENNVVSSCEREVESLMGEDQVVVSWAEASPEKPWHLLILSAENPTPETRMKLLLQTLFKKDLTADYPIVRNASRLVQKSSDTARRRRRVRKLREFQESAMVL